MRYKVAHIFKLAVSIADDTNCPTIEIKSSNIGQDFNEIWKME